MRRSPLMSAATAVVRRELRSTFYGLGFYCILTISFLVSFFIVKSYTDSMGGSGIAVSKSPLEYPLYVTATALALYVALCASMSVSREREQGTLEVLFSGPINSTAYVAARFSEQMMVFIAALGAATIYFFAISLLSGLELGLRFWATALSSVLLASYMSAFGLFLSTIARSARVSTLVFLLANAVFLGTRTASAILSGTANEALSAAVVYVKKGIVAADSVLRWVSPFSYGLWLTDSIEFRGASAVVLVVLTAIVYTAVFLVLCVKTLDRRGVRPWSQ